jgi:L-2-hydroxyglutarate oxidase LhgO
VLIIDRNSLYGFETSSRNSEVIHAGIYYPIESEKTRLCIRGRELLYQVCPKAGIPFRKVGKWIFATDYKDGRWPQIMAQNMDGTEFEINYLEALQEKCSKLSIPTRWVHKEEIVREEPHLRAAAALESPETGIIDSHSLMDFLSQQLDSHGGQLALRTTIVNSESSSSGFRLTLAPSDRLDDTMVIESKSVVNSAGLASDKVARLLMGSSSPYKLYHAKGHYYSYQGKPLVKRLTYPVPPKTLASLGVHTTLDLSGRMKFGPDVEYLSGETKDFPDYHFDDSEERKRAFHSTVQSYLPALEISKISADITGIRPKLAAEGEGFKDFVIKREEDFPRLINLVGIESPGLTSSLAIADRVAELLYYEPRNWL